MSFTGVMSARDLSRMTKREDYGEIQEAQRPIKKKKVVDISKHVASVGVLPTSVVIATKDDRLEVHEVKGSEPPLYYMEVPEEETEFAKYEDSIMILDGQHRLFSFSDDVVKLSSHQEYDITFSVYIRPTKKLCRRIFKDTNEKQDKVDRVVLINLMKELGLLENTVEGKYYDLIEMLANENGSPLKDRIIMKGEKNPGGIKLPQLIKEFDKIDFDSIFEKYPEEFGDMTTDKKYRILCNYFEGWEKAVGHKIKNRDKRFAAFSKISGIRFMLKLLPAFIDKAIKDKEKWTVDFVNDTLIAVCSTATLPSSPDGFFDINGDYLVGLQYNPYGSETETKAFAREWAGMIKPSTTDFNPFDAI